MVVWALAHAFIANMPTLPWSVPDVADSICCMGSSLVFSCLLMPARAHTTLVSPSRPGRRHESGVMKTVLLLGCGGILAIEACADGHGLRLTWLTAYAAWAFVLSSPVC